MRRSKPSRLSALLITLVLLFCGTAGALRADALDFQPITGFDEDGEPKELTLRSESVYMFNMDTNDVLIDIDSDKQRVPASLTKIMTAIVLLDEFDGDEELLKSTRYSAGSEAFDELYGTGASTADIQPFEELSCYDLLCALMLPSACEAANIIAIGMCGSIDRFVEKMNEKAKELKMNDSHFSNAHGLSGDNNYTTCADIAKMCVYALDTYPVFAEIVSMYDYTLPPTDFHPDGTYIYNTNSMLCESSLYYYNGCMGIKTGTLDLAGRCLASYAVSEEGRYMIVSMGAPLDKLEEDIAKGEENPDSVYADDVVYYNFIDHINLYEWAYDWIEETSFVDPASELREAKVEFGADGVDYVTLKPQEGFSRLWPTYIKTDEVKREIEVCDNVIAPVYAGDQLGRITLTYQGETLAEIPLVATNSVNRSKTAEKAEIAKAYPKSNEFKWAVIIIIVFAVSFVSIHIIRIQKKYKK